MVAERLDTAATNFQPHQMAERYTRLCRAYIKLSERFQQLDVEHMTLKGQMVPLLRAYKAQKQTLQQVQTEKEALQHSLDQQGVQYRQQMHDLSQGYEERIATLTRHIEELQPLEPLLAPAVNEELAEAESQMELVETTFEEMEADSAPDLSEEEQRLLAVYRSDPDAFLSLGL